MRIEFNESPWPLRPVGEICEILDRLRRPVNEDERRTRLGDIPYLGANGPVGTIDQHIFDEELVLVAEDGGFFFDDYRPIAYRWSGKCWVNNHAHVLRAGDGVDPDWLAYCLAFADVGRYVKGATRPKLNKGDLVKIVIPLPPLDTQKRIAGRIREAMERVEEMERLSRDVQVSARNLVKAELQTIIHDQRRAGHETVPLGDVTRTSGYGTSQRAHEEPRGVPVLRMGNIVDGQIDETDLKFVELPSPELARQRLVAGDVLVNRTNSLELVGKAAAFDPSTGERVAASYLVRVNVDPARVLPEWVAYCINGPEGRAFVRRTARRAIGMVNINSKEIARMPILLPPLDVQRDCVRRLDTIRSSASKIVVEHEENVAKKLRASILRQAFSGKL